MVPGLQQKFSQMKESRQPRICIRLGILQPIIVEFGAVEQNFNGVISSSQLSEGETEIEVGQS